MPWYAGHQITKGSALLQPCQCQDMASSAWFQKEWQPWGHFGARIRVGLEKSGRLGAPTIQLLQLFTLGRSCCRRRLWVTWPDLSLECQPGVKPTHLSPCSNDHVKCSHSERQNISIHCSGMPNPKFSAYVIFIFSATCWQILTGKTGIECNGVHFQERACTHCLFSYTHFLLQLYL